MTVVPVRRMAIVFLVAMCAYVALSYAVFEPPVTLEEAEACGFTSADFTLAGQLSYPPVQAWWISFVRQAEYWSAFSIALAVAFAAFALGTGRRMRGPASVGWVLGSGALAFGAVCLSCVAPVLSLVGLGVAVGFLAGLPKWLLALNTLVFTAWGTLVLSRRASACTLDLPGAAGATKQ